jgi:16S rRNA processing protein RimM
VNSYLEMGAVTRPHGLAGLVRAVVFADNPRVLDGVSHVRLELTDGRSEDCQVQRVVVATHNQVLLQIHGVADREGAEALRGARLLVPRGELPPLLANEFYLADTLGCAVTLVGGPRIGEVFAIGHNGAQPLFVVRDGARRFAVPAVEGFIVDFVDGTLILNLPDGLLEAVGEPELPER